MDANLKFTMLALKDYPADVPPNHKDCWKMFTSPLMGLKLDLLRIGRDNLAKVSITF